MIRAAALSLALAAGLHAPAAADVASAAPDGFVLRVEAVSPLSPDAAWARLLDIAAWWNGDHTYSGDAANLSLEAAPGGCWCELWDGGAVEHGRLLTLADGSVARFDAPFGPLQGMGVTAILSFALAPAEDGGTAIAVDYVVTGSSLMALDAIAPAVDGVISDAVDRLAAPDEFAELADETAPDALSDSASDAASDTASPQR